MAQRLAGYMHLHTMYWWLRPFGASVLVGSYDGEGPQLYDIDPSGLSFVRAAAPHTPDRPHACPVRTLRSCAWTTTRTDTPRAAWAEHTHPGQTPTARARRAWRVSWPERGRGVTRSPARRRPLSLPRAAFAVLCRRQRHIAAAVGKGKTAAKSLLEKLPFATLTCRQAVLELAKMCVGAVTPGVSV